VWAAWKNFKQLQSFEPIEDASHLTWGTSSFTGVAQKIGGNNTEIALQNLY
jgi:hypothetical protein